MSVVVVIYKRVLRLKCENAVCKHPSRRVVVTSFSLPFRQGATRVGALANVCTSTLKLPPCIGGLGRSRRAGRTVACLVRDLARTNGLLSLARLFASITTHARLICSIAHYTSLPRTVFSAVHIITTLLHRRLLSSFNHPPS